MSVPTPSRTIPMGTPAPRVVSHRSYRRRRAWRRHWEGFATRWEPIGARLQAVPLPFWSGIIVGVLAGMLVMVLAMKMSSRPITPPLHSAAFSHLIH